VCEDFENKVYFYKINLPKESYLFFLISVNFKELVAYKQKLERESALKDFKDEINSNY
jgi:hypothetical protein